jgi:hypothetical protein
MSVYSGSKLSLYHYGKRRQFDPESLDDIVELKFFRDNGKWREGCPFILDTHHVNIPMMCLDRFVDRALSVATKRTKKDEK